MVEIVLADLDQILGSDIGLLVVIVVVIFVADIVFADLIFQEGHTFSSDIGAPSWSDSRPLWYNRAG